MQQTEAGQADPRVVAGFASFSRGAGVLAVAVALLVLAGWAWDLPSARDLMSGGVEMKVNAALGMVLAGAALLCCQSPSRRLRNVSGALSLAILVLGGLTLAQYLCGFDAGLDTLWRDDPGSVAMGRAPGRMSQLSAVAFVLLGGAGIAVCSERAISLAQGLVLGVMAIALYALSAFGYHGLNSDHSADFVPVPLAAAALFLLMALGWLAARPGQGLMRVLAARSFGGTLARRALLPSVLVPTLLSYVAQRLQANGLLSPEATITLLAVASGGMVAWIIWSVSFLLDRVERERRVTSHLQEDANTDPLTQVPNRRAFQATIEGLLRHRREKDAVFSLLMLDLDRFKAFNDTHGHVAGDHALRTVAHLVRSALRPGDLAARYGGEEFAVLLPGLDGPHAVQVAERIRRDLHLNTWQHQPITISIGVAQAQADDDEERLVARADRALYAAKASGRDRVVDESSLRSSATAAAVTTRPDQSSE
ncbi:MAG: GGDEF domain-containing protein [Arenimonas sp.]|nr:GGDEF domain-containing protein [Arenimonas sp.]